MARVNVEQEALRDPRFPRLGKSLRCPNRLARQAGLGVMIDIWDRMTERYSPELGEAAYRMTSEDLRDLFAGSSLGHCLGSALTNVGLAEETNVGSRVYRIKGSLGRIEWLYRARLRARNNGMKGGRKPTSGTISVLLQEEEGPSGSSTPPRVSGSQSLLPIGVPDPESDARASFEDAWKAYPHYSRRGSKKLARLQWSKLKLNGHAGNVLAWIAAMRESDDWTRENGQFVPAMEVWLKRPDFTTAPPAISERATSALSTKGMQNAANAQAWLNRGEGKTDGRS